MLYPARMRLSTAGVATLAVLLSGTVRADIYSFVDSDGVAHFSNRASGDKRFKLYMRSSSGSTMRNTLSVSAHMPSDRSPERYQRYADWIREAATLYQIPVELVHAVIKVESDYDPQATSHMGAQGLMQLIPATATRMQVRDAFDPRENIFGGVRYLRVLANMFDGNLEHTVAGYNAGENNVVRFGGIPPFEETQDYVVKVLTYYRLFRTSPEWASLLALK